MVSVVCLLTLALLTWLSGLFRQSGLDKHTVLLLVLSKLILVLDHRSFVSMIVASSFRRGQVLKIRTDLFLDIVYLTTTVFLT